MIGRNAAIVSQEMQIVAKPRPGLDFAEAKDKWLAARSDQGKECNRILDDGGRSQPVLLVGRDKRTTVLYEVVPELCPPGFTVQQAVAHMRATGMDVRGLGPPSGRGHPTVVVVE